MEKESCCESSSMAAARPALARSRRRSLPRFADAQTYPARPVRIIVPVSPGGPSDIVARLIADKLARSLGKPFVIENQPGAANNIGIGNAARAVADGYTDACWSAPTSRSIPALFAKVPYDRVKRLCSPVTLVAVSPMAIIVNPSFPAQSFKDLIALLKANSGKYNYASAGVGTTAHLFGEQFKLSRGIDLVHVPFSGSEPAIQSALAGHTPIAFVALTPAVESGQGRQAARAGGIDAQALAGAAGCAVDRRSWIGGSGNRCSARHACASRYAEAGRRSAQRRGSQGPSSSRM